MVCFDIKVDTDDFIVLSTDGIFESMDIFQVVFSAPFRPISSRKDTRSYSWRKTQTKSLAESYRIAR